MPLRARTEFASLKAMSANARRAHLADALAATRSPPNGEVAAIAGRLLTFEERFGFTTDEMLRRVQSGALAETDDVCRWLMLVDLRDRLVEVTTRTRFLRPLVATVK